MEIFRSVIEVEQGTGMELFTNSPPLKRDKIDQGLIGIPCEYVTKSGGIDESKIGANASAEEQQEQLDDQEEKVMSCTHYGLDKMEDYLTLFPTKKSLTKYMKNYLQLAFKAWKNVCQKKYTELTEDENNKKSSVMIKKCLDNFVNLYENPEEVDLYCRKEFDYETFKEPIFIGVWSESGESVVLYAPEPCFVAEKA